MADNSSSSSTADINFSMQSSALPLNAMAYLPIKLTSDNYMLWKMQFLSLLRVHDSLGIVDGSSPKPQEADANYAIWSKKDQIIMTWLISTIDISILPMIVGLVTSQQIWEALARTFASDSQARVLQLRMQLQSTHRGEKSINEYMQSIKTIANNLAAIGHPVSDSDLVVQVLTGLGPQYDSFIPSITTRIDQVSLNTLHGLLSSHEILLQLQSHRVSDSFALSAQSAYKSDNTHHHQESPGRRNRGRGRGQDQGRGQGRGRGRGRCQICLKNGHLAHQCYKRFDSNFSGGFASSTRASSSTPSYPGAFSLTSNSYTPTADSSGSGWHPDSGATHHVTSNYDILTEATSYHGPDTVQIGNGSGSHHPNHPAQRRN